MFKLDKVDSLISEFEKTINNPIPQEKSSKLFTGVDLGTAYIVLAVVDETGKPVAGAMRFAQVVKDGLVVDYVGAVQIVKELKESIELQIGIPLNLAGVAYPPGTMVGDQRAIKYVAEGAGFDVISMLDEPTAANKVLKILSGAVIDIGGGTTGIAILNKGEVVYVADEATGGTHFNLVISGAKKITFEEAETLKKDSSGHSSLFPVVKPVMEKVATIIQRHIKGFDVENIYLAGGTSCFTGIEEIVQQITGVTTVKPMNPFLVTPLGIALDLVDCREA